MPTLFTKPIEALTAADVEGVIGWPETLTVEFKRELPAKGNIPDARADGGSFSDHARDKLFREIVALANTSGGHLILGIDEGNTSPPEASVIKPVPRCVDLAERLARSAAVKIDPPIPLLLVRGIEMNGKAGVVVFRVPASLFAPHRAPDKECYARRGTETKAMTMREIQDMTLSSVRRSDQVDAKFASAKQQFSNWLPSMIGSLITHCAGFRITAVPIGAPITLGRLYNRRDLFRLDEAPKIILDGSEVYARLLHPPSRERPILRGVRWEDEHSPTRVFLDAYSDGAVSVGFRHFGPNPMDRGIYLSWVLSHAIHVLRLVHLLRTEAGQPECEYGVEVEFDTYPKRTELLLKRSPQDGSGQSQIGTAMTDLPLTLPRVSFGPIDETSKILSLLATDICDAVGEHSAGTVVVELDVASLGLSLAAPLFR